MVMKIKATRDLVLVKLDKERSDLVLPDTAKEKMVMEATKGTVVSAGPECKEVKEGDFIHYNSWVGNEIKDEELKDGIYIIVAEKDILCRKPLKSQK